MTCSSRVLLAFSNSECAVLCTRSLRFQHVVQRSLDILWHLASRLRWKKEVETCGILWWRWDERHVRLSHCYWELPCIAHQDIVRTVRFFVALAAFFLEKKKKSPQNLLSKVKWKKKKVNTNALKAAMTTTKGKSLAKMYFSNFQTNFFSLCSEFCFIVGAGIVPSWIERRISDRKVASSIRRGFNTRHKRRKNFLLQN